MSQTTRRLRVTVFFKYSCEVVELRPHLPEMEDLEFRFGPPRSIVIRLTRDSSDCKKPPASSNACCVAETAEQPTNAKITSELDSALAVSSDSPWAVLKDATPATVAFLDDTLMELARLIVRFVTVFRWRVGLPEGPHNPFSNRRGYISKDGKIWREVSLVRRGEVHWGIFTWPVAAASEICDEIVKLVSEGVEEPLGHQLFREAWNQRETNPRSSLVIGVAAAEVGLKKLIGSLVPNAAWLVDELQTPSFSKMLGKYLPTLPVRAHFQGTSICPPKGLVKVLNNAIECRNKLVHAGKTPPHRLELEEMLRAINDFLWICDVYEGRAWAAKHVSAGALAAWKAKDG